MSESLLGKQTDYPTQYAPDLLHAIPRAVQRKSLGLSADLPFKGLDIWHAYELSWLNRQGIPQVALGSFIFDCASPNIIESKSFKLYLNSLNQERIDSIEELQQLLQKDLSARAGAKVDVSLSTLDSKAVFVKPEGICLDSLNIEIDTYEPDSALLQVTGDKPVRVSVYSNLFRSNCPITRQPDWATISIAYQGAEIVPQSLLAYLISYRLYNGYHEDCVEKIFLDIDKACQPESLTVQANFLRRGGLDINPIRSTKTVDENSFSRFIRQ